MIIPYMKSIPYFMSEENHCCCEYKRISFPLVWNYSYQKMKESYITQEKLRHMITRTRSSIINSQLISHPYQYRYQIQYHYRLPTQHHQKHHSHSRKYNRTKKILKIRFIVSLSHIYKNLYYLPTY